MALGAERRDVLRLVLTRALRIVVAGLIVGGAGAVGVTRVLQKFLFGATLTLSRLRSRIVTLLLMAVGADRVTAARAPRDTDRPVRCATRGVAVNGSDPSVMGVRFCFLRHGKRGLESEPTGRKCACF